MKRLAVAILLLLIASACAPAATATPTPAASPTPSPVPTPHNGLLAGEGISEIHMFGAQRGWGWAKDTGGNTRLVSTADGGVTWTNRSPKDLAYGQQGASFLDADHAWLPIFDSGTSSAGLVRTSDGGKTWEPGNAAAGLYTGYEFYSATDGLANTADVGAGNAYLRFYASHDAGTSWAQVTINAPAGEARAEGAIHICSICGDTGSLFLPGRVILTHGDLAGDPQGAVRLTISADLGKTWKDLQVALPSITFDGAAVAPAAPIFFDTEHGIMPVHIFKTQDFTNYAYEVLALYSTKDGGQTWTPGANVAEDIPPYQSIFDMLSMTDGVVQCGSSLCVTHDAGQTWTTVKPDLDFGAFGTERQLAQIDFIDLSTGWAVINDDDVYKLYKTTDGGATWNPLSN